MSIPEEELHIVLSGSLSNGSRVVFRQRPSGGAWSVEDINTGTYGIRLLLAIIGYLLVHPVGLQ
jgi:hypothetical protein